MLPNRWHRGLLQRIIKIASCPCRNLSDAGRARKRFLRFMGRTVGPVLVWASLFGTGTAIAQECLQCHSLPDLNPQRPGITIAAEDFENSVHGSLGCAGCHADVGESPHGPVEIPQCKTCHTDQAADFLTSIHGQARGRGDREAPTCQNCHGNSHEIKRVQDSSSPVYHLNLPKTCGACHGNPELARRHRIPVTNAYQLYMDSIHGRAVAQSGLLVAANCSSCHGSHNILPKSDPASKVYRTTIPTTCGSCHAGVLSQYLGSAHSVEGKAGNSGVPVCSDCHTAHEIARVEREAWKLEIIRECGLCHEESLRTYRDTFHGQITGLGFTRVARCSDCHGAHDILPASDGKSSVSATNRVATCQKCHPQATVSFARFSPHADPKNRERNAGLYYSARFMNLLLIGVFLVFGVHTGLWLIRSLVEQSQAGKKPAEKSGGEDETRRKGGKGWGA